MAVIRLPRCTATVTFHLPSRRAFCRAWIVRWSHSSSSVQAPLLAQRGQQTFQIAGRLVHVRLFDHDVVQAHRRVELDIAQLGALAHDLLVNLAVGRHVDDRIAEQQRLAGQAAARLEAALVVVAGLDLAPLAQVLGAADDAVLGELADALDDLAAAAEAAAAADGIDVDAQAAGRLQHRRADGKRPRRPEGVNTTRASSSAVPPPPGSR